VLKMADKPENKTDSSSTAYYTESEDDKSSKPKRNIQTPERQEYKIRTVIALICVCVIVVFVLFCGFILYLMIPAENHCYCCCAITFGNGRSTGINFQYQIEITDTCTCSGSHNVGDYKVSLVRNGTTTTIASTTLVTSVISATTEKGGQPLALTTLQYNDANSDGKVTKGDMILISNAQGGSTYEVTFFYKDLGAAGKGTLTT